MSFCTSNRKKAVRRGCDCGCESGLQCTCAQRRPQSAAVRRQPHFRSQAEYWRHVKTWKAPQCGAFCGGDGGPGCVCVDNGRRSSSDCGTSCNCGGGNSCNCSGGNSCNCTSGGRCNCGSNCNCSSGNSCNCTSGGRCNCGSNCNCNCGSNCNCSSGNSCNCTSGGRCTCGSNCNCSSGSDCNCTSGGRCNCGSNCNCSSGNCCNSNSSSCCSSSSSSPAAAAASCCSSSSASAAATTGCGCGSNCGCGDDCGCGSGCCDEDDDFVLITDREAEDAKRAVATSCGSGRVRECAACFTMCDEQEMKRLPAARPRSRARPRVRQYAATAARPPVPTDQRHRSRLFTRLYGGQRAAPGFVGGRPRTACVMRRRGCGCGKSNCCCN